MQPFTLAPASGTTAVGVLAQSASSCAAELLTIRAWATRYGLEVLDLGTSAEPNGARRRLSARHRAGRRRHHPAGAAGGDGPTRGRAGRQLRPRGLPGRHPRRRAARRARACGSGEALLDERTALVAQIATEPARRFIAFNDVVIARLPGLRPGPAEGRGRGRVAARPAGRRGRHRFADRLDGLHGRGRRSGGGAVPRCHRHHAAGLPGHAVALARGRRQRGRPGRARSPTARR